MAKVKMSLHRALAELKAYDNRINNAINERFIASTKKSIDKINGKTIPEVINNIKGNFVSVRSLIDNRNKIKAALVNTNSNTYVNVAGREYSLAEAIERKNSIGYEDKFLTELRRQFSATTEEVRIENDRLQSRLETYLQNILGEKEKRNPDDINRYSDDYRRLNEHTIIDPNDLSEYIKSLGKEIIDFTINVDYVISEKNSETFIEVELVD